MNKASGYFGEHLSRAERYKKQGQVIARPACAGEFIITIVGGHIETVNTADENDFVVKNINVGNSGEEYLINKDKFAARYAAGAGVNYGGTMWVVANATGEVDAVEYKGETFTFVGPWGEDMIVNDGDFLCLIPGEDLGSKVYRIEREAFNKTYAK